MTDGPSRPLTRTDARTLCLASLGGALEFYDFIIYVFFAVTIGHLFFPPDIPDWLSQLQVFGIFAAGYLARPLGGIIMAHFGDRVGRKRMFLLSLFLMAVPTLLIGLMPTYETIGMAAPVLLLLMRLCQGAAIGGEAPGAWVFVSEHVPPNRVGLACGLLTAGLATGVMLGSLVAALINAWYSPDEILAYAWRIPFIVGGVFGFIAMYLRRWLAETPVFEAMRAQHSLARELPLKQVLHRHRRGTVISMLATWMLTAFVVVILLMTPTLLQRLHGIAPLTTLIGNIAATGCVALSAVMFGVLIDRFGLRPMSLVGTAAIIVCVYALYLGTAANPDHLLALYALAGIAGGATALVPVVMVRSFPDAVRFSGVSFSYNVAYAISGGLTPLAVQMLLLAHPLGPAHYVASAAVVGLLAMLVHTRFPQERVGSTTVAAR